MFRDSFFHADMHPGNIFVSYEHPEDPQYIGIDCGIVGSLNKEDKRYLAENFIAFFNRDYRKVAELHVDSGWVPPDTNVEEFEFAIRTVCEPIFEKPLAEISFGHVLLNLFNTARRFNMEVQPQLVLLQKTLLYVEGVGRQLYPQLDLWKTAKPFLESWIKIRSAFRRWCARLKTKRRSGSKECRKYLSWCIRACSRANSCRPASILLCGICVCVMCARANPLPVWYRRGFIAQWYAALYPSP